MTDKELLYIEDALAHAKHFDALCCDACDNMIKACESLK